MKDRSKKDKMTYRNFVFLNFMSKCSKWPGRVSLKVYLKIYTCIFSITENTLREKFNLLVKTKKSLKLPDATLQNDFKIFFRKKKSLED